MHYSSHFGKEQEAWEAQIVRLKQGSVNVSLSEAVPTSSGSINEGQCGPGTVVD